MDVVTAVVSRAEASKLMRLSQRSLHGPAPYAQPAAVVCVSFRQHRVDAAATKFAPMRLGIVATIALKDLWALTRSPWLAADGGNRIDQRQQLCHVVRVRAGQDRCQRDSLGIRNHVMLATAFSTIGRVGAGFLPPVSALSIALSTSARDQLIWSARCNFASKTRCSLSHTPAACQAVKRRQQVMPLPQPISCGKSSQAMPVFSTKRIPVNALRLPTGGRTPLGKRFNGGSSGSITSHNSSESKGLAILDTLDQTPTLREKDQANPKW